MSGCDCNPELTSSGYHRVECPKSGVMPEDHLVAQQASHDYLRAASELVDHGAHEYASICARAAQAEVDDPETVVGDWCGCMVCQAVRVASNLRRQVG